MANAVPAELDPRYLEELREAFLIFDKNRDGTISVSELEQIMQNLGEKPTREEVKLMVAKVDKDGDGNISFDEFVILMASAKSSTDEELRQAFNVFDTDGSGTISRSELKQVMQTVLGEKDLTDKQLDDMLKAADLNGDGEISFQEFCIMMKSDL